MGIDGDIVTCDISIDISNKKCDMIYNWVNSMAIVHGGYKSDITMMSLNVSLEITWWMRPEFFKKHSSHRPEFDDL